MRMDVRQGHFYVLFMMAVCVCMSGCGELGEPDTDHFVGTYQGSATLSGSGSQTFTSNIIVTAGTTADLLISVDDLRNIRATVQGDTTFTIDSQSLPMTDRNGNAYTVTAQGNGTVVGNVFAMNATLSGPGGMLTLTANGNRL
ncbi:hypothetical protein EA187_07095 [Lujinxingia sediminis]|uniref:Lipocalin-like domain-containing protein n=1 Tax=Lujinxingia sediminis TaxID=2480984 RepID=A0ABY0CUZ5_9DELT|nr:hypothetical protein [Lujinxingia sediminis]RVU46893.1 hypothetical protein EA187_07095 [Lujinxingia sediminis]